MSLHILGVFLFFLIPDRLVSDCCLIPNEQLFSSIMIRISHIWWNGDDAHFVPGQHA